MDHTRVAPFAAELVRIVEEILEESKTDTKVLLDHEHLVSWDKIYEVASFVIRDLGRIEDHQNPNGFPMSKFVGYTAFWFAKIKPLGHLKVLDTAAPAESNTTELKDVNERIALIVMNKLVWLTSTVNPDLRPNIWKECKVDACEVVLGDAKCKGYCYQMKYGRFATAQNGRLLNYIVYGLRARSLSPYFIVNHVDQLLTLSCESQNPPIFILPKQADG